MQLFGNVSAKLRDSKRWATAALGGLCVALVAFFAGTWAGSSGMLTLGSHPDAQLAHGGPSAGVHQHSGCCDGDSQHDMSTPSPEPPAPSHPMPGGSQMPGATHPGDTHQMPGGSQMPGATHPGDTP